MNLRSHQEESEAKAGSGFDVGMPRALRTPFQRGHEVQFALEATQRDEKTGAVVEASCRLCACFGREQTPGQKRVKRASIGRFHFPFRVDTYKRHHKVCHPRMWQRYQAASTEGKRSFFGSCVALTATAQPSVDGELSTVPSSNAGTVGYGLENTLGAPEEFVSVEARADERAVSWSDIDVMKRAVLRDGKEVCIPYVTAIKGRLISTFSCEELHRFCLHLGFKDCIEKTKSVLLEYLAHKKLQGSEAAVSTESARDLSDKEVEDCSQLTLEPPVAVSMRETLLTRELRLLGQREEREKRREQREAEKAKADQHRAELVRKREVLETWSFVCDRLRSLYRELVGEQHPVIRQQLNEEIVILEANKQQLAQSL